MLLSENSHVVFMTRYDSQSRISCNQCCNTLELPTPLLRPRVRVGAYTRALKAYFDGQDSHYALQLFSRGRGVDTVREVNRALGGGAEHRDDGG